MPVALLLTLALFAPARTPHASDPNLVIEQLSLRVEAAEEVFRQALGDLARLNVPVVALEFDQELRRIEGEAWALEGRGLEPRSSRHLELAVLDPLRYARHRMHHACGAAKGSLRLARLLTEMRAATDEDRPELVLAIHEQATAGLGQDARTPALLRRQLRAITAERAGAQARLAAPKPR